jgi:hypothetical protein
MIKNFANEIIYCCGCQKEVEARLTSGEEIYPIRNDIKFDYHNFPFWKCDTCKNFVGCHHKTKNPTKPLGCIPTKEISNARKHIHALIDPLWKNHPEKFRARGWIYNFIAKKTGKKEYHTAEIRSVEEAREIYKLCLTIKNVEDFKNCKVEEVLRQEIEINQAIEKDIIFNKSNNFASQRIQ